MRSASLSLLALLALAPPLRASPPPVHTAPARVTILYDAFGTAPGLTLDWGFAALIEYDGRRILFDTGDNAAIFEKNVRALRVDLRRLDFAVISHRHGDHIAGLSYLLRVNPKVKIYAPRENFGVFGSSLPGTFFRADPALPKAMRYFDGAPAAKLNFGSAWPEAHFTLVDTLTEVAPGVTLVSTVSHSPGTLELRELSLVIRTPTGALLVVGCSHPGIEAILQAAAVVTPQVALIVGGLHWVTAADSTIARLSTALHDSWHVRQIGPGHCTGEPGFAALQKQFGVAYLYAGLGTVLQRAAADSAEWESRPASSPD
jgi:7,8-dihydropterin-6-yl-methyl-4-(beta-D-ribofuranosyl)aminobenzene 5'-phosphate synthase